MGRVGVEKVLWVWVVLAVGGVAAEVHTGTLAGAGVAAAAVLAGALAGLHVPPPVQLAAFAGAMLLLLGVVRPLILRQRMRPVHPPELLIGKLGTVTDPTDEHLASGRVTVEGVPYVARCAAGVGPLPAGAMIRVLEVDSGELVVQRL